LKLPETLNSPLRTNTLVYTILLAAHVMLVWLLPYFPTQDGPCHLYNLVILQDLLHGGKEWGNFFTYTLHLVPNLGFNLLAYPLINFLPPLVVERVFLTIYIVLMGSSVPLLLKTFGRPIFPFAYFVFPVIFNYTLLMGFFSYTIAVPLFILSFCLAWKVRNRSRLCKFVCFNLLGLGLFYFHLIPAIYFLISLAVITTADNNHRKKLRGLTELFIIISPFLLNIFYYLSRGSGRLLPDLSYLSSITRLRDLIKDLFYFSTFTLSPWQLLPGSLFMAIVIIFLYSSVKETWQTYRNGHSISTSEQIFIIMIAVFSFIYLVAPSIIGEGSYFNQRMPWVILIIMLPFLRTPQTMIFQRYFPPVIASLVAVFFILNAILLWQENVKIATFLGGLRADIPKGAPVLAFIPKHPVYAQVDVMLHAASYYGIYKGSIDLDNYEARYGYFPVHFKNGLPQIPSQEQIVLKAETIKWTEYPSVQYLLGWDIDKKNATELSNSFHIICENGQLVVWQRNSV
jgi:hypothetical protein